MPATLPPLVPVDNLRAVNSKRNDREIRQLAARERKAGVGRGGLSGPVKVKGNNFLDNVFVLPNRMDSKAIRVPARNEMSGDVLAFREPTKPRIPTNKENMDARAKEESTRRQAAIELGMEGAIGKPNERLSASEILFGATPTKIRRL
jgi:hypothetical protein